MSNKILITIGRQYGSGGREIGVKLSQRLGIDLFDKEILKETAKQNHIDEKIFEQFDEKPTNSFLYSLVMGTYNLNPRSGEYELPLPEKVFIAEHNEIKKIADTKSAIFIGRCADYTLKDYDNCISIFVYAPLNKRIERIKERQNVAEDEAEEIIRKADKKRASYY
jgi:cytidylate kinase